MEVKSALRNNVPENCSTRNLRAKAKHLDVIGTMDARHGTQFMKRDRGQNWGIGNLTDGQVGKSADW
ncbi:MAG: hypothetical protein ACK4I8_06500 [Armatimonadota bacterium]